jgi:hypothetical protein
MDTPEYDPDSEQSQFDHSFEEAFEDALAEAWKDPDFTDLTDVSIPLDIAIDIHAEILNDYLDHMENRRALTLDEQVFASAYKQAIMCYRILWFFNFAIEIEYFEKAQALRELKREAERLLVDQGLPSTLEEWGDPSGNRYRIEFDKKMLEATLKVDLHSFARRFSDLCGGYMEEEDEDE